MDSILSSIKKLLGIEEGYLVFDNDLIICINTALGILTQIGVGPSKGFSITGAGETWTDFLGTTGHLEMVKNYVFMKVRLLWDVPSSSVVSDVINKQLAELEWRISVTVDPGEDTKNE